MLVSADNVVFWAPSAAHDGGQDFARAPGVEGGAADQKGTEQELLLHQWQLQRTSVCLGHSVFDLLRWNCGGMDRNVWSFLMFEQSSSNFLKVSGFHPLRVFLRLKWSTCKPIQASPIVWNHNQIIHSMTGTDPPTTPTVSLCLADSASLLHT